MKETPEMVGQRFGRLVVVCRDCITASRGSRWICACDCGKRVSVPQSSLRSRHTKSCGCLHDELSSQRMSAQNRSHGLSHTRMYGIWTDMKKRCNNKNHWAYSHYGGRGIGYADEWELFENFHEWSINNGYDDSLTLDRIDNNAGYSPANCRWATRKEQANNKSNTKKYTVNGGEYTLSQLSEMHGIPYHTLHGRVAQYGWCIEKAISTPPRKCGDKHGATRLPTRTV